MEKIKLNVIIRKKQFQAFSCIAQYAEAPSFTVRPDYCPPFWQNGELCYPTVAQFQKYFII